MPLLPCTQTIKHFTPYDEFTADGGGGVVDIGMPALDELCG
ncbi:hypothetical protein [Neisseria animalis]|nr:hypothetical protein [Neisseria animalis]